MFHRVEGSDLETLSGVVGNFAKYAPKHEFGSPGGKPAGAKGNFAAIPLPDALTPSGVPIAPPREWPNTVFIRTRSNRLLLCQKIGNADSPAGGIKPLFLLIRWENIGPTPARLGIHDTMKDEAPKFAKRLSKNVAKVFKDGGA